MIGLLDPALLLPREGPDPSRTFCEELDEVLRMCRKHNVRLLPIESYWNDLWSKLGQVLEKELTPTAKKTLHELRKLGNQYTPVHNTARTIVWRRGFQQLFGLAALQEDWELRMASAVAVAASFNETVIMFVRRMVGRNLIIHRAGNSTLDENLRWVLHIQPPVIGHQQILCVHHSRNLSEKWTCRYDWRLPSVGDGATYPFRPADNWWKPSTVAFRTVNAKTAWIDRDGNGWARPNIPGGAGYHWDVFIHSQTWRDEVGARHINVVAFGVPPSEGKAGNIHH